MDRLAIEGVIPTEEVWFTFEGERVRAHKGESVAAALLAAGRRSLRITGRNGEPRGYFCGMGVCWECTVNVAGLGHARACRLPVTHGLQITMIKN